MLHASKDIFKTEFEPIFGFPHTPILYARFVL